MPSIYFDPSVPGSLGRVVLRRRGNRSYFSRPPCERRGPGVADNVRGFHEATASAKAVYAHPARRATYEEAARKQQRQLYHFILSDFLRSPVIRAVDVSGCRGRAGDAILVTTRVGLPIAEVRVALRAPSAEPKVREEGVAVAVQPGENVFRYVVARDVQPANGGRLFADLTVRDVDGLEIKRSVQLL